MGSRTISICDHAEKNWYFKPNCDVFLNLTKCFFVPKPNQDISTGLWQETIEYSTLTYGRKGKGTFSFHLSVVLQKHTGLTFLLAIGLECQTSASVFVLVCLYSTKMLLWSHTWLPSLCVYVGYTGHATFDLTSTDQLFSTAVVHLSHFYALRRLQSASTITLHSLWWPLQKINRTTSIEICSIEWQVTIATILMPVNSEANRVR